MKVKVKFFTAVVSQHWLVFCSFFAFYWAVKICNGIEAGWSAAWNYIIRAFCILLRWYFNWYNVSSVGCWCYVAAGKNLFRCSFCFNPMFWEWREYKFLISYDKKKHYNNSEYFSYGKIFAKILIPVSYAIFHLWFAVHLWFIKICKYVNKCVKQD